MNIGREAYKLCGPVRHVRTENFEYKEEGGCSIERLWFEESLQFSKDGRLLEITSKTISAAIPSTTTFVYDQQRRLSESRNHSGDLQQSRTLYRHDAQGRLVEESFVSSDNKVRVSRVCRYEANNRKVEDYFVPDLPPNSAFGYCVPGSRSGYGARGAKIIRTLYDDRGYPSELVFLAADESLVGRVAVLCDDDGNIVEQEQFLGDNVCLDQCCSPPPDQALSGEEYAELASIFAPGSSQSKVTRSFEGGRVTEETVVMGGLLVYRHTFVYDPQGNEIETREYGASGGLHLTCETELEYDGFGNWTAKLGYLTSDSKSRWKTNATRRKIEYF